MSKTSGMDNLEAFTENLDEITKPVLSDQGGSGRTVFRTAKLFHDQNTGRCDHHRWERSGGTNDAGCAALSEIKE
jgi:hypothetical protein